MSRAATIRKADNFYAVMEEGILATHPNFNAEEIAYLYTDGFVGKEIIEILSEGPIFSEAA
jgi:hypothetical protein